MSNTSCNNPKCWALDCDTNCKHMSNTNEKAQSADVSSYDTLECPECDKLCNPDYVKKNGTVVYKKHSCINSDSYYFSIDIEGNLIEKS